MPAKGEPSGSCGGAQGNEPACPGPGAALYETDPTFSVYVGITAETKSYATTRVYGQG